MNKLELTLDGKELPKRVQLYRDENMGAIEVHYWRFHPMLFFAVPFMCVWTYMSVGKMYVEPLLEGKPIATGVFGIPFVLGALYFWGVIVLLLFGRGRVRLEYGKGRYSFKVFGIGITRPFDLHGDTEVVVETPLLTGGHGMSVPFGPGQGGIRIRNGHRSVNICTGWSADAIDFVCAMLRQRKA